MGGIKQTGLFNTVNVGSGGSKGGSEALILGLCLLGGAYLVLGALSMLISALTMLLIWATVVLGLLIVFAVVLGIVFRKRLAAHFGGPGLVRIGEASLLREPDRDMPKLRPESSPREIIHTHRHYVMGPGTVYTASPDGGWAELGDFDVIEAEILP